MKFIGKIQAVCKNGGYLTVSANVCALREERLAELNAVKRDELSFNVPWSQHVEGVYRVGRRVIVDVEVK